MNYKLLVSVIFFSFLFLIAGAQQTEKNQSKTTYRFCEIIIQDGFVHNRNVSVDYGQSLKLLGNRRLTDKEGNDLKFNSVVDALNYMSKLGWEYFQVYTIQGAGTGSEAHYVFRKEIQPGEDCSALY